MYEGLDDELQQMDEREVEEPELVEAVHLDDPIGSLELQPLTMIKPETTLSDGIRRMIENNVGCLLVVDGAGTLVGIFTERDVIHRVVGRGYDHSKTTVGEHMTPNPSTLSINDPVAFALNRMYERGYRHIPIIDEAGKPLGFVSIRDIVNHLAVFYRKEVLNLPPDPVRRGDQREGG